MLSLLNTLFMKALHRISPADLKKYKYCCICKTAVDCFHTYRGGSKDWPPLMTMLEMIGSDVDNFSCPSCGAHDRERHLFLYLDQLGILTTLKDAAILHFAPEKRLMRIIDGLSPAQYVKGDLYPADPTIEKIDMLNISYESESFDFIFANHVLEHVADDLKALSELHRTLKPGGMAILQTPYCAKLQTTFQDAGIDSDEARLYVYGQEDHVRLYGNDIFRRFEAVGFKADIRKHANTLPDIESARYGVNPREPLFLFRKQ